MCYHYFDLLYILVITFFISSCAVESPSNNELININANPKVATKYNASELFENIRYVILEAKGNGSYLNEDFIKVIVSSEELFIFQGITDQERLLRYSLSGKLLGSIQIESEGTEKIVGASDFLIDEKKNMIEILDYSQKKIALFDLNGQFKGYKNTISNYSKFAKLDDDYLFFAANQLLFDNKRNNATLQLSSGDTIEYLPIPEYLGNYRIHTQNFSNKYNQHYLLKHFLSKDFYQFNKAQLVKKYTVDFGDKWVKEEILEILSKDNGRESRRRLLYNKADHIYNISTLYETDMYIIITFFYQNEAYWIFYNKKLKKSLVIDNLVNDLDYGLIGQKQYWPRGIYNDHLLFVIPSVDIITNLNEIWNLDIPQTEQLLNYKQLSSQISTNSNSILVFAKLKDTILK